MGIPVVGLGAWTDLEGVIPATAPEEAVAQALEQAKRMHATPR